jgi:hypothetical protein
MIEDTDYISVDATGRNVWINPDFPDKHFNADDLRKYVTRNLDHLSLEQWWADRTIALLRRLDASHKT